jgi:hypothetical protein
MKYDWSSDDTGEMKDVDDEATCPVCGQVCYAYTYQDRSRGLVLYAHDNPETGSRCMDGSRLVLNSYFFPTLADCTAKLDALLALLEAE